MIFFITYFVGLALGIYLTARFDDPKQDDLQFGITMSILWPLVGFLMLIFGPFILVYWLGARHREKLEARRKEAAKREGQEDERAVGSAP